MRLEKIGKNVNGEIIYRIFVDGDALDSGDVVRRCARRWAAQPAVRGEVCPSFTFEDFGTRQEAIEYLLSRL